MGQRLERRFLIVVGEASGDAHAARLVTELKRLGPCGVHGVTGPALEAVGAERGRPMDDLAVIGFSAVLPRLPRIWQTYRVLLELYETLRPAACVLVDSPGFNFRIGPALKRRGAKIFYYIAPQVWAWHAERAAQMAGWVDRLAVVFPFEEPLFRDAGVATTFVGHPLLDGLVPEVDEAALRRELGIEGNRRLVGLLPGSRSGEIRQHLEVMLEGARELASSRPDLAFVVALSSRSGSEEEHRVEEWKRRLGRRVRTGAASAQAPDVRVARGRTLAIQAFARSCAVASGTATLETALFGTPLAIVYRAGALNYAIAKRVIRLQRIGLPNIVAGEEVAPELLQDDFTATALARTLEPWLDDPAEHAAARARLAIVRGKLGAPGASARAAALLRDLADA